MSALGSLVVQLAMDYAQYQSGWDKTEQETLARTKRIQEAVDGVKSTASQFAVGIGASIAAVFSVSAMKSMIDGITASQVELKKLSETAGVSVEKLSGMAHIAKASGTDVDQLTDSMNQLTQKMVETKKESDPAAVALQKIGINFKEFRDLTPDEQFLTLAKSLDRFEDGAGKSAAIMAIMGEEGAKLLPFMKDLAAAGEIQAKVTAEQIEESAKYQRALQASQASNDALKTEVVNGMVPALNLATRAYNQVINGTGGVRDEARNLAADGSIKDWTMTAVKALSYVIDAGQYVWRTFQSIGKGLGGLAASAVAVADGDFKGAFNILQMSGQDMIDAFKGETWGEKFRTAIDQLATSTNNATGATQKQTLAVKDFVEASDEGSKAAEREAQAYLATMGAIDQKIAALSKEAELGRQLTESEKELIKVTQAQLDPKKKLNEQHFAAVKARIAEWNEIEKTTAATKLEQAGLEASRQQRAKYVSEMQSATDALAAGNKSLREEIELIGKNDAQRLVILKNRNLEIIAIKEAHAAELAREADATGTMSRELANLQADIELLRERNGLLDTQYIAQGAAKAADATQSAWKSLYDNVSGSFTDALMNGGMNAKDYLKGMLRSLFVQPFVMNIVGNLMGIGGGGAGGVGGVGGAGGGGGVLGLLSNASTLYSAFGSGLAATLGSTLASAGTLFGSSALSAFGAGMQGSTLAAGLMGPTTVGAGGAMGAGASVGSMLGAIPGWGWMALGIGALFGGDIISGLFGRKLKDTGIEGKFGGETGFEGNSYKYYKGGLFRSNKTTREKLDEETRSAFADQFFEMDKSIREMGDTLGLGTDALDGFTYDFKISLKGLSDEEAMAKLQEVFGQAANKMAELVLATDEYTQGDETRLETLTRLSVSLTVVNGLFETLGATLLDASLASGDWASSLIEAAGGVEQLMQSAATFYDLYYSTSEKRERVADVANKGMESKGLDLRVGDVDAKAKYRALLEKAIADKDEAMVAWLLQFADEFAAGVDAVTATLEDSTNEMVEIMKQQIEEANRVREDTLSTLGLSMDGLVDGFINEINEGRGADAGSWLANEIAGGFERAVYEQAITAILSSMIDGMITPMITAALTGSNIADAVSTAAINNMIANANAALKALNALLESTEFKEGMEKLKTEMKSLGNGLGSSIKVMATYRGSVGSVGSSYSATTKAANSAADASKKLADQWRKTIDSMLNEMERLRSELLGAADDQGASYYEALFAIKTAQARAGDQDAADELPEIIRNLEDLAKASASSQAEVYLKQAEWLASLADTRSYLAGKYGVDIENQQVAQAAATTAGAVVQSTGTNAFPGALQSSSDNQLLLSELRALRVALQNHDANRKSEAAAIVPSVQQTNKLLRKWDSDGLPATREEEVKA
ncbi:hypothetical protein [Comamonas sp.]|uniref:hypothetical protein n=1 Tax=Comamonas sp. TaxID=34028 RepID=UPI0028A28798|nr:hypothetical protein [Comamonas sp.]